MTKKWVAYLMSGDEEVCFDTKRQAENYVISQNCPMCKGEGLNSACAMEWAILKVEDLKKCKNINDIFKAAGYKDITAKKLKTKLKNKII